MFYRAKKRGFVTTRFSAEYPPIGPSSPVQAPKRSWHGSGDDLNLTPDQETLERKAGAKVDREAHSDRDEVD